MHSIWLPFAKVVADTVAAALGILGILGEFRGKDRKMTRRGKAAMLLILASFVTSGVITALEFQNAKGEQLRRGSELKRVMAPLGEIRAEVTFDIDPNVTDAPKVLTDLKGYFVRVARHKEANHADPIGRTLYHDLPPRFQKESELDDTGEILVAIYRRGVIKCDYFPTKHDTLTLSPEEDLAFYSLTDNGRRYRLLKEDPTAAWERGQGSDETLVLTRSFNLTPTLNSGGILSIEDLDGATLTVREKWDDFYSISRFELQNGNAMAQNYYIDLKYFPIHELLCGTLRPLR